LCVGPTSVTATNTILSCKESYSHNRVFARTVSPPGFGCCLWAIIAANGSPSKNLRFAKIKNISEQLEAG